VSDLVSELTAPQFKLLNLLRLNGECTVDEWPVLRVCRQLERVGLVESRLGGRRWRITDAGKAAIGKLDS
jgi:hypothetical protein